jgi:hypothetical protein
VMGMLAYHAAAVAAGVALGGTGSAGGEAEDALRSCHAGCEEADEGGEEDSGFHSD